MGQLLAPLFLPLLLAVGAFAVAFVLLVWAVGWHRPRLLWLAGASFLLSVGAAGFGLWRGAGYLRSAMRGRTGQEVYESFFGRSPTGCVRVTSYQDTVVPVMDATIWLHMRTCPAEVRRIIRRQASFQTNLSVRESYPFAVEDGIEAAYPVVGFQIQDLRRASFLVLNRDSTAGYFQDMLL